MQFKYNHGPLFSLPRTSDVPSHISFITATDDYIVFTSEINAMSMRDAGEAALARIDFLSNTLDLESESLHIDADYDDEDLVDVEVLN